MKKLLPLLFAALGLNNALAQFTINPTATVQQMINNITGNGVIISNPVLLCPTGARGIFSGGNNSTPPLGINNGIILTTGTATGVDQPSTSFVSQNNAGPGDPLINNISPSPLNSFDRCRLEFDIQVTGDTLRFDYVFGSEEYTSFVCTNYNDAFGFFVSGPKPGGGVYANQNVALIPGTNIPVLIGSVNDGTPNGTVQPCYTQYTNYYVTNTGGTTIAYDGFTVPLRAQFPTIPCSTYRIILIIADVGDGAYDSGVFLEAGSFQSTTTTLSASSTSAGIPFAVEGCVNGQIQFNINPPLSQPYTINYTVGGTATNGVDYNTIGNSVTIPAGATQATIGITPINDGLSEGLENVKIYLNNPCTGIPYDSATLNIFDSIPLNATSNKYNICVGDTAQFNTTGGINFLWTPANSGLSAYNIANPIATPSQTTTYQVQSTIAGCTVSDTFTVFVSQPNFTVDAQPAVDSICANEIVQLTTNVSAGSGPYTYQWTPNTTMIPAAGNISNPTVGPIQSIDYRVVVTGSTGCKVSDTVRIIVAGVGPQVTATASPSVICPGLPVQLNFNSSPVSCGPNYTGCVGLTANDSVGTAFAIQTGSPVVYPSVYGNYAFSARHLMLWTAAELQAEFGGGGSISRLGFQIGALNSNATLQNFSIKMRCVPTTTQSLSNWFTGMNTVFTPKNVTPTSGWNMHTLDTLFNWDGVSNLLVEVCFNNPTSGVPNNKLVFTTTPTNTLYYKTGGSSSAGICNDNTTTNSFSSNQRPKIRMEMCQPDYNSFVINWTPSSGPNAVSNPAIRNPTTSPQSTQTYQVQVSQNGCIGSNFVTVTVDTSIRVSAGADVSACLNQLITLQATPTGNVVNPTYSWTNQNGTVVANGQTFNPTVGGSYVITMQTGGCIYRDTVVVSIGQLLINETITQPSCAGSNNGTITVAPAGQAPYTFGWSPNVIATGNTSIVSNLPAGVYYVTVTDNLNCQGIDTFTLVDPSPVVIANPQLTNPSCFGSADGAISITASGGTGTLSYNWSHAPGTINSNTAGSLSAGTYSITAQDANNCQATTTYTLNNPTALSWLNASSVDILCFGGNNGNIQVNAQGGTGTINYQWSQNPNLTTNTASALPAGVYTISAIDQNACAIDTTITLTQPANALSLGTAVTTPALCFGACDGTADIQPAGGTAPYSFTWSNGQNTQTASSLCAATYTLTVQDQNACQTTGSATINQPAAIQINEVVTNSNCFAANNGAVDITVLNAQGNTTFVWSQGALSEDVSNLQPGNISVTVTDANNCSQTETYTISEPTALSLGNAILTPVSCFGGNNGSIALSPSGGSGSWTFSWNPGAGNTSSLNSLTAGTYQVTMSEPTNATCQVSGSYTITQPTAPLTISNGTASPASCFGDSNGSVIISANGGTTPYSYSWNGAGPNTPSYTSIPAGNYTVVVTDLNGCTVSDSYTVTQPAVLTATITPLQPITCAGGSDGRAVATANGGIPGYSYLWSNNTTSDTSSGWPAGTLTVLVTDQNGCTASASASFTQPQPIAITLTPIAVSCNGGNNGSISAVATGGTPAYVYQWSVPGNTATLNGLSAGTFSLTVLDVNGCSAQNSTTITQPAALQISLTGTAISCVGNNDGTIQSLAQGGIVPYSFTLSSNGAVIQTNNSGQFSGLAAAQYTVVITDQNNCINQATINLAAAEADVIEWSVDSTSCFGPQYQDGSVSIAGLTLSNQPYQYAIDNGPLQYSGEFFNLSAGPHTLLVVNAFGCSTNVNVVVPQPANGIATVFPTDTLINLGESITLQSSFSPYPEAAIQTIIWSPGLGLSCSDCANPIATPYNPLNEYIVTYIYNGVCTASATVRLEVINRNEPYIPNVFSPNGDGLNDVFNVFGAGIRTVDLRIFNRWGELVFQSNNTWTGWDGTYKGQLQNPAVFTYYAAITYLDGKEKVEKGTITLVR